MAISTVWWGLIMNYKEEALKIQKEILELIEKEDFDGIQEVLNKRKAFYIKYSEYNGNDLKMLLNSEEYRDSDRKINIAFSTAKEKVKEEIKVLRSSKKATKQYQNNSTSGNMFFNKKV